MSETRRAGREGQGGDERKRRVVARLGSEARRTQASFPFVTVDTNILQCFTAHMSGLIFAWALVTLSVNPMRIDYQQRPMRWTEAGLARNSSGHSLFRSLHRTVWRMAHGVGVYQPF
jgi:hypothetical protein